MAPVATGILTVIQDGFGVCVSKEWQRARMRAYEAYSASMLVDPPLLCCYA